MAEQDRALGLAGASPARPRDPKILKAEADEAEAKDALAAVERARKEAEEAEARAELARKAAEESRLEAQRIRQAQAEAAQASQQIASQAEREQLLGTVHPVETPVIAEIDPKKTKRVTDKFFGSLGLFLLRIVFAGLLAIFGWQVLTDTGFVVEKLTDIKVPTSFSWHLAVAGGICFLVAALLMLVGWGTRIVSAGLTLVGIFVLVFYRFGPFSPFMGFSGFVGDRDLLLTVVAFCFVSLGAGGWSIDHAFRASRAKRKAELL